MSASAHPMFAACVCSHTQRRHYENEGLCQAIDCECGAFRAADPTGASIEVHRGQQLLDVEPVADAEPAAEVVPLVVPVPDLPQNLAEPTSYMAALPASVLFVDPTYQRPKDEVRVRRMIDNFDVTQLGVLEVSARDDGTYAIVEGQHRWHAAKVALAGKPMMDPPLVCKIHTGLTVAQEAALFFEIDRNRKALNFWDRYKSRRAAGDPLVSEIETVCARKGYTVNPAALDGNIAATAAMEKIMSLGGAPLLSGTLAILSDAYGHVRDAVSAEMLQGVALILANYDAGVELNLDRLTRQLSDMPPRQFRARAVALREGYKAELPRLVAAVIIDRYNAASGQKVEPLMTRMPAPSKLFGPAGQKTAVLARVRRWAIRNGHPHDVGGRLPQRTIDLYNAAQS